MTRMTGSDCAVMCNLINIHTYIHTYIHRAVRKITEIKKWNAWMPAILSTVANRL